MNQSHTREEHMDLEAIDRFVTAYLNDLSGHIPTLDGIMVMVTGYGAFAIVAAVAIRWWWNGSAHKLRERHLAILCGLSPAPSSSCRTSTAAMSSAHLKATKAGSRQSRCCRMAA
jgi:hypothetical protein